VKRSRSVEEILPLLESEDAFVRLEGEKSLRGLVQRDFGFRWDGAPGDRASAVERVRRWIASREKAARERRRGPVEGTATLDIEKLKGMTPQQVEQHLQALLGKSGLVAGLAFGRPRCGECGSRPSTVEIVRVDSGRARGVTRLCDPCAAKRGEFRG
jgi:hypothetical protein